MVDGGKAGDWNGEGDAKPEKKPGPIEAVKFAFCFRTMLLASKAL